MKKSVVKVVLCVTLLGLIVFVGLPLKYYFADQQLVRSWQSDLVEQLQQISSFDVAMESDLGLGSVLSDRDDKWIVVGYQDTHHGRLLSLAIAKTQDGRWFESRRHFCGTINSGRGSNHRLAEYQKMLEEMPDQEEFLIEAIEFETENRDTDELWIIGKEPDPDVQVQMLFDAGFTEIAVP